MTEENAKNSIIRMFHVHKRYGPQRALVDIDLDIAQNEFLFITGPSGAGKSTLLKLFYWGEPATEGQVLVNGMNLSRIPHKRIPFLRRQFGIIFQDYKLIPTKSVFDNIALVLEVRGVKRRLIEKKTRSVLRTVGMETRQKSFPPSLSGGEQQRIAIARAVVGDPKIILADEPTGSLDAEAAAVIIGLLKQFHRRGATVIVATHDQALIGNAKGRILHLREGRLLQDTHTG
jgi:cell division transport system ATP-binding protein